MKGSSCLLLAIVLFGFARSGFAQATLDRIADSITAEGKRLYASERTSWDGTDIFLEKFKDRERLGGYFSYSDGDSSRCVFYSRDSTPQVLGCVSFDSSHAITKASYGGKEESVGGFHSHNPETGPFMTATDVCTLLLYERIAKWKSFYVMSRDYVSIWSCERDMLVILTMEAWKRINKDQEKWHRNQ